MLWFGCSAHCKGLLREDLRCTETSPRALCSPCANHNRSEAFSRSFWTGILKVSSGDGSWGRKLQRGSALFPNLRSQSSVREHDTYTQREAVKGLMQVPEQLSEFGSTHLSKISSSPACVNVVLVFPLLSLFQPHPAPAQPPQHH